MKTTQHATQRVYGLVPMQNLDEVWNDEKLYKKYNLVKEEIDFIERLIREI